MKLEQFFNECILTSTVDKSDEWLIKRKSGIGGSEAATILGKNEYQTLYDLYLDKVSDVAGERITNEAIEKGNRLEQPLIDVFFALHPDYISINTKDISLKSKKYSFMNANLDGAFIDQGNNKCILEIKTTTIKRKSMVDEWPHWDLEKNEFVECVPNRYFCQVLHYLAVTGFDKAIIFALLDYDYSQKRELHEVVINKEDFADDIKFLIEEEKKFWERIVNRNPPNFMENITR